MFLTVDLSLYLRVLPLIQLEVFYFADMSPHGPVYRRTSGAEEQTQVIAGPLRSGTSTISTLIVTGLGHQINQLFTVPVSHLLLSSSIVTTFLNYQVWQV